MPRRGRRPGVSVSRATILAAARRYFAAVGYDRATIRAIARAAKVDPALVLHYFGTKETLFSEALVTPHRRTTVAPRIDYQLSQNNTLVARYNFTTMDNQGQGIGNFTLPSRAYSTSTDHAAPKVTLKIRIVSTSVRTAG